MEEEEEREGKGKGKGEGEGKEEGRKGQGGRKEVQGKMEEEARERKVRNATTLPVSVEIILTLTARRPTLLIHPYSSQTQSILSCHQVGCWLAS